MSIRGRVRATLMIAALWGGTWAAVGLALGAGRIRVISRFMFSGVTVLGVCGLVAGAGFALALSRAERRQRVGTLSARRSAVWGALGGGIAGLVATVVLGTFSLPIVAIGTGIMTTVGSASAVATVRAAQAGLRSTAKRDAVHAEREPVINA